MALYKCGGGTGAKVATGEFTAEGNNTKTVTLGFKPKYLAIWELTSGAYSNSAANIYMEAASGALYAGSGTTLKFYTLPSTTEYRINSITDTGFVFNKVSGANYRQHAYFAIG